MVGVVVGGFMSPQRVLRAVVLVLAFFATCQTAHGFCFEPTAPSFYGSKPVPPQKPYCINEYTNTHTCSDWEIDSYNSDVDRYNSDLRFYQREVESYVSKLQSYVDDTIAYAKCEIDELY